MDLKELQAELDRATAAGKPSADATGEPISQDLGNGVTISGKTPQEFAANMASYYKGASNGPTERNVMRNGPAAAPKAPYTAPNVTSEAWAKLVLEDPVKAQNLIDQARFGMENPVEYIKGLSGNIAQAHEAMVAQVVDIFQDQNPDIDLGAYAGVLQQKMAGDNRAFSMRNLKWAVKQAQKEGLIPATTETKATPETKKAITPPEVIPSEPGVSPTGAGLGVSKKILDLINDPATKIDELQEVLKDAGAMDPGSAEFFQR